MTDAAEMDADIPEGKKGKKGLLIGLVAALVLGGAAFYATFSGMIGGAPATPEENSGHATGHSETASHPASAVSTKGIVFVRMEPIVVSLSGSTGARYLRFGAQLEVGREFEAEVTHLLPRVVDILNGYLRAVDARDLENSTVMARIRAQMLRRIQVVVGEGRVRDLLIAEFVLN
ncbi:MAG: flagellar basal body-associated protein FliL [Paracoccaceae bacterium]